jgi:hypothetical protein
MPSVVQRIHAVKAKRLRRRFASLDSVLPSHREAPRGDEGHRLSRRFRLACLTSAFEARSQRTKRRTIPRTRDRRLRHAQLRVTRVRRQRYLLTENCHVGTHSQCVIHGFQHDPSSKQPSSSVVLALRGPPDDGHSAREGASGA